MGSGAHLEEWLTVGEAVLVLRHLAMRIAYVNEPKGRGYNEAFAQLIQHHGYHNLDKQSITCTLWLLDNPRHRMVLRETLDAMEPGPRSRLNSPISARQRVEKVLKSRAAGTEERMKESPVALLKKQIADKDREIADLKTKVARSGSLFDLKQDDAVSIGRIIGETVSEGRLATIMKAAQETQKKKKRAAAG
jgi:hypothetical protein